MAKIDLSKFKKEADRLIKTFKSPRMLTEAGNFAADRIRLRTRLGKGIGPSGAPQILKKLSPSYRLQRAGKIAFASKGTGKGRIVYPYIPDAAPKLHPQTSPNKSNLTFTGQLLDSIGINKRTQNSVTIGVSGRRTGSVLTNKDVQSFVEKERPFMGLTKPEQDGLSRFIASLFKKLSR